jgi:hypothetical protein
MAPSVLQPSGTREGKTLEVVTLVVYTGVEVKTLRVDETTSVSEEA